MSILDAYNDQINLKVGHWGWTQQIVGHCLWEQLRTWEWSNCNVYMTMQCGPLSNHIIHCSTLQYIMPSHVGHCRAGFEINHVLCERSGRVFTLVTQVCLPLNARVINHQHLTMRFIIGMASRRRRRRRRSAELRLFYQHLHDLSIVWLGPSQIP